MDGWVYFSRRVWGDYNGGRLRARLNEEQLFFEEINGTLADA